MKRTPILDRPTQERLVLLFTMLFVLLFPFAAIGEEWQISGSNTMRSDYYDVKGDDTQAPYTYEGVKSYNEINLNVSRRASPYDLWKGEIFGVVNGSPYRSSDYGLVPEKLNLTREKGDVAVPFRVEMGDVYSYFTYRTLQSSLKGLQVDLQPFQSAKRRHSIMLVSGAQQSSWRHFYPSDSYFNGASYLIDDPKYGKYSLNYVYNTRQGDDAQGTLWRSQSVYSIAGSNTIPVGDQKILMEGEISQYHGDHDGTAGAESGQARNEKGYFFQASGKGKLPLTYRFRYEEYGAEYRPTGASITPGLRATEYHMGWMFTKGYQVRGRVQDFRNSMGTINPVDTLTYGLNLTGPLGTFDAFTQDIRSNDRTTYSENSTLNLNINLPRFADWNGSVGILYQKQHNRVPDTPDTTTKQINISAGHGVAAWGWNGTITPGFVLRRIDSPVSKALDVNPTLSLTAKCGFHSIDYSLAWLDQTRLVTGGVDVGTLTNNLSYRYTTKKHLFGVEYVSGYRSPDPGRPTDSYKIGAFWTYYFEKTISTAQAGVAAPEAVQAAGPSPLNFDIATIPPGSKLDAAMELLKKRNITSPVEEPGLMVYEARVFEEFDLRQRIALIHKNGLVRTSAVIIDAGAARRPQEIMQTYEKIRSTLMDTYGRPSDFFERGTVTPRMLDDIRAGAFIRIMEWKRPQGTIRFGIPRRLDGQVRMELQFAESFPPYGETLWSLEEVR